MFKVSVYAVSVCILQAGSEKKLLSVRMCYPDIKPNSVIHTPSDCIMQKLL